MAYGSKYRSNFYNYFGAYIEIDIKKKDYSPPPITDVRNIEVQIEFNFQGNDVVVHGTGASIVIINPGDFTAYEDLLTSKEKEFWCEIKYDGQVVFQGFSLCDLNEQQFNYFPRIKIQFTDYLTRLNEHYAENFFIASNTDLLTLLQELYLNVGFTASQYELYVNSTLYEENHNIEATDTFLKQTYIENNMLFSEPNKYDSVLESVNKTLKSFGAFFYSAGDKWILERQEDILRSGGAMDPWVKYTYLQTPSSVLGLKQELNKQVDFEYVDMSQVLSYTSGLKTLILNLKDKQLDTLVFNNYGTDMNTVDDQTPEPGSLVSRTWFKYGTSSTGVDILYTGNDFRGMASYVKWTYPLDLVNLDFQYMGLYYEFEIEFTDAMGNVSEENPIVLNVNFKMTSDFPTLTGTGDPITERTNFAIRVDGGNIDGKYLAEILSPGGTPMLVFASTLALNEDTFTLHNNQDRLMAVSKSWDLTSDQVIEIGEGFPPVEYPSVWSQLGNPASQKFMIFIYPSYHYFGLRVYNRINYLGDVQISITQQKILNKLTYYISDDFVKTSELDIDFFDLTNVNFANGFMYGLGGIGNDAIGKTQLWRSERQSTPVPLMDILAQTKFRNYSRTIHSLKGSLLYDGYIKPFAVLTDDNRPGISFLMQGYTWDLNSGIYEFEAEEYTDEDIIVDASADPGAGGSGTGGALTVPDNIVLSQGSPGDGIDISWDAVIGATGYIIRRQPYVDNQGFWVNTWKTIWEGGGTSSYDPINTEADPMPGTLHITYQVAAKNIEFYGPYSANEVIIAIF